MKIELKVPEFGESVTQVQIGNWRRRQGDHVERDEELVELETDKATMELAAPTSGVISQILKNAGETANIGDVIAYIDDTGVAAPAKQAEGAKSAEAAAPGAEASNGGVHATPSARRELRLHGLQAEDVTPSGKRLHGRDVARFVEEQQEETKPAPAPQPVASAPLPAPAKPAPRKSSGGLEEIVPMTPIRRKIAERLVMAQQQAALLTTFNEIDMSTVMDLRRRVGERFKEKHGVKLGFMSFFVKATIEALRTLPELNAEIRGTDIVYRRYYHIGIAIGSQRGLVVPVLRNAELMSFAEIERAIVEFAKRAGDGKLLPDELQGGTFTISNGGVYGSMLSTPIVNPPQSGVLGMHAIDERPVARQGQVVIRPMMYIALTYDHRIVDGREAVTFLKQIKETVEDPTRILFEM
jgi:2-oxoglutarate dehydrogenase E2 component (dihydrolipoamide succinyltransferase)